MNRLALLAFGLLSLIWGGNFILIKWVVAWISAEQTVLLRLLIGLPPVLAFALATGGVARWHLRYVHHFAVMGFMATAFYYVLYARGIALLPSSIAGMLSGSVPLFTFLTAALFMRRSEPVNLRSLAGVLLGFAGILAVAQPWTSSGTLNPLGVLYMLIGSLSLGGSFVYARRFVSPLGIAPAALTAYQMGFALPMMLLVTPLHGIGAVFSDTRAWISLVFGLALAGTGLAYIMYYFIVAKLGAVIAAASAYLPPVIALIIGMIAGETPDASDFAGMVLILAGVFVVQTARSKATTSPSSLSKA